MAKKKPQAMLEEEKMTQEVIEPPKGQDPSVLSFYIQRLNKARDERAMARKEFDGMTFETDYERNREALFSFLRPKKNEDDVRVNSGTAEKKIELMLTELLSVNFQPEIRAYNEQELELVELSADLTDIIKTTNRQEHDDDTYQEAFQDLLSQRCVILEERIETDPIEYSVGGNEVSACITRAVKRRISGLQVFFGDMYIPAYRLSEQPYIVIYDRKLYSEAPEELTDNPNWKYVIPGSGLHDEYVPWFKYRFSTLREQEIEIITYLSLTEKGLVKQVIVNGVMMYEPDYVVSCQKKYPLSVTVSKMIPDFIYGKPPIASAKFLAALQDETLVNLIRKFRQALEPPLGVTNGKVYSRDIWAPAAVTQGLTKNTFDRLIDHQGVTPSEFQMFNLITQKTEEFIGAVSIQQQPGEGKMTATQTLELQKTAIKMLGLAMAACIRMKREMTYLRIGSFFEEYVKPYKSRIDEDENVEEVYRIFEIPNGKSSEGETVKKVISLVNKKLSKKSLKDVLLYEEKKKKETGEDVRYSFLDVKTLATLPLIFDVIVTPESRDSSQLDKILFQERLSQAAQLSQIAQRPIDGDKAVEDFERTWKTKGIFQKGNTPAGPDAMTNQKGKDLLSKADRLAAAPPEGAPQATDMRATLRNLLAQPNA